jgi:Coenzyme PQQ synthesis protein D (PqqD)
MKLNDRFITVPLDEGLILARRDGHRLFVMNGSARFMWERRAEGVPDADIPQLAATHYGIDVQQAQRDFGKALSRWQVEGLAEPPGHRRHYVIGGVRFSVHFPDESVESEIAPTFAHLEVSAQNRGAVPHHTEFDLALEDGRFVLRTDGLECLRCDEIDDVIDKLALSVVRCAYDGIKWLVSVHAAALGRSDGCILVPGASGSGKSTLTAALLASGHFSYLTDDISLLDPATLRIVPVPGALVLKSGSWEPLKSLLPDLSELAVRRRGGQQVRYWTPPTGLVATQPLPVKAVVFARYEKGRETELVSLSSLEGLSHLIGAPCTVNAPISAETVGRVAGWSQTIPFYTLAYGSLADATQVVEDLLGS